MPEYHGAATVRAGKAKAESMRNPQPEWLFMDLDEFDKHLASIYPDHEEFMAWVKTNERLNNL